MQLKDSAAGLFVWHAVTVSDFNNHSPIPPGQYCQSAGTTAQETERCP